MKTTMKHFKTIAGTRRLALCLASFMMLMTVLPMMSRTQAAIGALTGPIVVTSQIDIVGPAGSGRFGTSVSALPNGNIVVTDPFYDITSPMTIADVGAVYLYNGATGALISKLTGSAADDHVGSGGVTVLTNGNYVVISQECFNQKGAVTWCNGATGINGVVSPSNSLIGSSQFDFVGSGGATALTNGNYVVRSIGWANGTASNAGAVTWGNGATGIRGVVSAANSLVGSIADDLVGIGSVRALTNGNYVVRSPIWNNGGIMTAGAVTWGNGATGISGPVSSANSLVGSTANDQVGFRFIGIAVLSNGNYVVSSPVWDNGAIVDAGAATWGNGATGISGPVSVTNSLVGSTANDQVSASSATALTNGNYVVNSPNWSNGAIVNAGAATWGNGATGIRGVVSAANSLVGSTTNDLIASFGATPLTNGNYVVRSVEWDNGAIVNAGAFTLGIGDTGFTVGPITASNSVLGTAADGGFNLVFTYDYVNQQLIVGRPDSNIVTLFRAREFDACLQDDFNPTMSIALNTQTGDYIFCAGGTQYSGTGVVTKRGNTYTLQHNAGDRRVQVSLDVSANRATASLQKLGAGGGTFSLTDRDIRNDTCPCLAH